MPEGVCRECRCTDETPCGPGDSWVEPDLCSYCADDEKLVDDVVPLGLPSPAAAPIYREPVFARKVA